MKLPCYTREKWRRKCLRKKRKWEGEVKPYSTERESHPHTLMAYISGPAGEVNDSTTPNSTTGDTTHAGVFM
jgi:hypothetical protein